jgi:hypothetical protein
MVASSAAAKPSPAIAHRRRRGGDLREGAKISGNLAAPPAEGIRSLWRRMRRNPGFVPVMAENEI